MGQACGLIRCSFGRLTYLWASWGWCTFSEHFSTGTREVGIEAQFGGDPLNILVLGSLGPPPTPTSIGHLIGTREVGIEIDPMWPCSEGDPLCAVTRSSIGHLVEDDYFMRQEHRWAGEVNNLAGL